jgi:transcriptional regulator with XRE-family HTH domain
MEFGKRLRELRKQKSMTLEALAAKIGSSKGYLSGIENEKVNPPTERFVRKMARIFGQEEIEFLKMAYLDKVPRVLQPEFGRMLGKEPQAAAPAPSRSRPGEAASNSIPLLNSVGQGYPNRIGAGGVPESQSRDQIQIPGLSSTQAFAITVCGDDLAGEGDKGFKEGDIAVVARSGRVADEDVAFAIYSEKGQRQALLRQVKLQDGETVALQSMNRNHPIVYIKRGDMDGLFKVIGRIAFFQMPVPASSGAKRESGD